MLKLIHLTKLLYTSLLVLIISFSNNCVAQSLSQDTLGTDQYFLEIANKEDAGNKNAIYILQVLPKVDNYRMITALYCKDSSLAFRSYTTPNHCVEWVHDDDPKDRITKVDHGKSTRLKKDELPDSTKTINKACLNSFYVANNDTVQVDTIYVEKNNLAYSSQFYSRKCSYVNDLKHGAEILYYQPWELKGECIHYYKRVRLVATWQKGKKTGEWLYYDVNGVLIKKEIYKKGKLKEIKTRTD